MAKGQLRGNRETKKPKQPKKIMTPLPAQESLLRINTAFSKGKKK